MKTQDEILNFLRHNREYLAKHYHVTKIALFGSFARNQQSDSSDVDLLFELEEGTQNVDDLKNGLKAFLSSAFERNVDLAREKYLKPYAKQEILKDALYVA